MVGKTNLTFISKGDASSVQLIQKSYITDSNGIIWKMEIINGKIFAFSDKNVMMGTSMENLEFLKKGQEYLRADHIIYKNGRYYLVEADVECEIYTTEDFVEYGKVELGEEFTGRKNVGIFLDSSDRVIFVCCSSENWWIYRCDAAEDLGNADVVAVDINDYNYNKDHTYMRNNKILWNRNNNLYQVSLSGSKKLKIRDNFYIYSYAAGYFFYWRTVNGTSKMYRSRDVIGEETLCPNVRSSIIDNSPCVIPVNGKICILYSSTAGEGSLLNVSDDILSVGSSTNELLRCSDYISVCSVLEYDGKTYVGTGNGIIYELALDYEGIIQRPDVAIIKTLAAKQALEQSLQYTDDCIAKLKEYIDSKMGEESPAIENSSTEGKS